MPLDCDIVICFEEKQWKRGLNKSVSRKNLASLGTGSCQTGGGEIDHKDKGQTNSSQRKGFQYEVFDVVKGERFTLVCKQD